MSTFDNNNIMPRYTFIAILMTIIGMAVVVKSVYTMTVKRDYWMKVANQKEKHEAIELHVDKAE